MLRDTPNVHATQHVVTIHVGLYLLIILHKRGLNGCDIYECVCVFIYAHNVTRAIYLFIGLCFIGVLVFCVFLGYHSLSIKCIYDHINVLNITKWK